MKIVIACLLLISTSVFAGTPSESLAAFQKATKEQKLEEAWKHTAQFEGASEELTTYLKSRIERILKISADGWSFDIVEEKVISDCAVVLINESVKDGKKAFDIDPVFMIKQGADWKVMPNITAWDMSKRIPVDQQPASMKFDEPKIEAFKALEKWSEERKQALIEKREP